ncbi:MAG: hypothetical protein AB1472_01685 [Candidatus Omnitrophota bacterium]
MKKSILLVLAFILIIPIISSAASISGTETILSKKDPARIKGLLDPKRFSISVDNDYVFKREMKTESWSKDQILLAPNTINYLNPQAVMDESEIDKMYRVTAKIKYAIFSNLSIFVKLGIADVKIKEQSYRGTLSTTDPARVPWTVDVVNMTGSFDYKIDEGFVYGGGLKLNHNLSYDWILGLNLQYLKQKHDYVATRFGLMSGGPLGGQVIGGDEVWDGVLTIREWYVASYIAKKIGKFIPYLGVKYSDLRIRDESQIGAKDFNNGMGIVFTDVSTTGYIQKYKSKHHIGPFIGLDCNIGDHWQINLEGRFVDETAMTFNATYKF